MIILLISVLMNNNQFWQPNPLLQLPQMTAPPLGAERNLINFAARLSVRMLGGDYFGFGLFNHSSSVGPDGNLLLLFLIHIGLH